MLAPEILAQRFHEAYERLAPSFSYETRKASAKPWAEVPENNRRLMTAACAEILAALPAGRAPARAGTTEQDRYLAELAGLSSDATVGIKLYVNSLLTRLAAAEHDVAYWCRAAEMNFAAYQKSAAEVSRLSARPAAQQAEP